MSGNKRRLEEDDRINTSISDSFTDTQVDNRQLNIKKNKTISSSKSELIKNFNNFIILSKNNSNNNDISSNLEFFKNSHRFIITKNDNIYDKLSSILKILNNKSSDCSIDNNEQTTDFLFLSMDSNSIQKLISIIEILKQKFNILNSNTGNGSENGNGNNNGNNNKKLNFKNDKLSKNIYSYDKGNKDKDNDNININYYLRQFNYLDFTNVEKKSVNENNQEEDFGKLKLLNSDSNNKNGNKLIKKPIFYINLIFSLNNSNFNSDFFNSKFKFLKENNWTLQYD